MGRSLGCYPATLLGVWVALSPSHSLHARCSDVSCGRALSNENDLGSAGMSARFLGVLLPDWSGNDVARPAATFLKSPTASTHLALLSFV
ncbi:hypothetical protein PR002_g19317 [Phytophthora rubi]|uniref:Secreted protein n=1 Tax=Phytophthora rubi TaxID=129364 RepID=A0A6A3JW80_9STRA|nr:hypothetical protein PR002_g19317 [Phytophthora rubi]